MTKYCQFFGSLLFFYKTATLYGENCDKLFLGADVSLSRAVNRLIRADEALFQNTPDKRRKKI